MSLDAKPQVRDYVWALASLVAAVGVIRLMIIGVVAFASEPTLGQLAVFAIGTLLVVGVGRWIIVGAWRRTVWGAPAGGVRDWHERRAQAQERHL